MCVSRIKANTKKKQKKRKKSFSQKYEKGEGVGFCSVYFVFGTVIMVVIIIFIKLIWFSVCFFFYLSSS